MSSDVIDSSETIIKNFYVDDLLKLVEKEKHAVRIIKWVKEMFTAGGFNSTQSLYVAKVMY